MGWRLGESKRVVLEGGRTACDLTSSASLGQTPLWCRRLLPVGGVLESIARRGLW